MKLNAVLLILSTSLWTLCAGHGIPLAEIINTTDLYSSCQEEIPEVHAGALIEGDIDNDGVPDEVDNCPDVANPGQNDKDKDGVGDACDPCNNNKHKGSCDDKDPCTINDVIDPYCNCAGTYQDSDGDGVCDALDVCRGFDDNVDINGDGIPDGCACENMTADAGSCEGVYLGYPPMECATLQASGTSGSAPYTYLWSTGEVTSSLVVCPEINTVYTVTITDIYGCTAADEVMVDVKDVRCGSNNHNVIICQYNMTTGTYMNLCQRWQAVQGHLEHGDMLGECFTAPPCVDYGDLRSFNADILLWAAMMSESANQDANETGVRPQVSIFPNPTQETLTIRFDGSQDALLSWRIFDLGGNILDRKEIRSAPGEFSITIDVASIQPGMYVIEIQNGDFITHSKLIIAR